MKRVEGNGDTKRKINAELRAPGYIVFTPENLIDLPEQFPVYLSMAFSEWLRENPRVRIREVLPIVDEGRTIILHVWFSRKRE